MFEIIITIIIITSALFLLYKNISKSSKGKCTGCSGKDTCPSCNIKKDTSKP